MVSGEDDVVLLVDDDPTLLRSVARSLRGLRVQLRLAHSAEEALGWMLVGGKPLAVVSDQQLGGMTGLELLAEVARLVPDAGRVLHTGERSLAFELVPGTCLTIVSKPAHPLTLRRAVEAALPRRRVGP
jgi:DNA-binding NtrC family response regulator